MAFNLKLVEGRSFEIYKNKKWEQHKKEAKPQEKTEEEEASRY